MSQVQTIADKAFAKASQVEQTADGIQVTLTEVEATADSAKTNASTALSTANSAKTTATNAAKTATNYLKFDSSGLCVGNMTGTLGYNTLIKSTGVDIRNGSTVLSSFGASEIALGANSASSSISLVGDSGYIKGSQYGTYGNLSLSSTGGVALVSGPRNSVSPSDNFLMVKQSGISLSALGGTGKTITFSSAYASGVLADFPVGRGHTGEWTWMTFASDIRIAWLVHGRWAFKANAQSYTDFTLPWTAHNANYAVFLRTHELRLGLAAPRLHRGALHHHQRHHDQVPRQLLERLQFRLHVRRRNHGPRQAVGLKRKEKSMHGIMAGDVVVLTNDGSGMEVVDVPEPMSMGGYKVESHWEVIDNKIYRIHAFVPIEGTAEEAALNLSRLQFMSLPDNVAYEFRALAEDWIAGSTYYGPEDDSGFPQSRVRYQGELCKCLQTHVSQSDWTPTAAPSLWAKIPSGQEGNEPEEGYAEWEQPGAHERGIPRGTRSSITVISGNRSRTTTSGSRETSEPRGSISGSTRRRSRR